MSTQINALKNNTEQNIFKVAQVINNYELVINAGSNKGITEGSRFLVYSLGKEVVDPDTNESLGKLEIIKGIGKVIHVQEKMSTIKSTELQKPATRRITKETPTFDPMFANRFWGIPQSEKIITEEETPTLKPFNDPQVGDFVKYIP